ncbi:transmembrane amino acid transporter protein-domain-containing protein [Sporodiniella umbellata]|nr:transmembrane amino acid transporter protein-domain-containing protein [Sporodiniella umbellata]
MNTAEIKTGSTPSSLNNEKHAENHYDASLCEEQIEHVPQGTASPGKALFMLLKAFIGTGVIFLPGSFINGGIVLSVILMVILGSLCLVAFQLLVVAQRQVGGSYGDVAKHLYGTPVKVLIEFFLCISQIGFVSSYFIFISQNIGLVVNALNNCNAPFDPKYYIWIILALIIPVCWVRKIARLSWIAIVADTFIAFGLICVLYFTSDQIAHHGVGNNIIMVNSNDFAFMIGTAVFSYEGIGMVVPVIEGMKNPEKFPRVLNIGIFICTLVFTLIGAIGYIAYGDITQASVVANIPHGALSTTVQILYACAMILTSPFMLYPPLTILEKALFGKRSGQRSWKIKWLKNCVRSLVPLVCAAISFGVGAANLDKFVSLVGSFACLPLCFIFPGLFHLKITKNRYLKIVDIVLIAWGFGIMVYTMYVIINSWIHPATRNSVVFDVNHCSV